MSLGVAASVAVARLGRPEWPKGGTGVDPCYGVARGVELLMAGPAAGSLGLTSPGGS